MVSKPILIKEFISPSEISNRYKTIDENLINKKKFILNTTSRNFNRFESLSCLDQNDLLYPKQKAKAKTIEHDNDNELLQPRMKFNHRSELERITEAINKYSYGKVDVDLINKQLTQIPVLKLKNKKNPNSYSRNSIISDENLNSIKMNTRSKASLANETINSQAFKHYNNTLGKEVMPDLHLKTHFKSASMFLIDNENETNLYGNKRQNDNNNYNIMKKSNSNSKYSKFINEEGKKKINDRFVSKENSEIMKNPLIEKPKVNLKSNYKKMEIIKKMYSCEEIKHEDENDHDVYYDKRFNNKNKNSQQYDKIIIDGKEYYKEDDYKTITKLMLNKCNYLRNKSKFNEKFLIEGNGKLASTGGLTISEFNKKYKFNFK